MIFLAFFGVVLLASIGYSSQCPKEWNSFETDNTCIKGFDTKKSFTKARQACQSFGGDLVQVKSEAKQKVVALSMTGDEAWIGVEWKPYDKGFSFLDGSYVRNFKPWAPGEPDNYEGDEDCVKQTSNDKWEDFSCYKPLPFVCEIKDSCPESWSHYPNDNLCIKSFDTPLSYNDARKKCQDAVVDGDLVEIKNEALTNFILGLNLPMINWIGVQDSNDDQVFEYLDGSGVEEYQPWDDGEPNNWRGTEQCGMVYGQGERAGKWNDAHCPDAHPFICSKTAN